MALSVFISPPFDGKLPVISDLALRNLAAGFQPLLLDCRIGHVAEVSASGFEVPGLRSELSILGRVLGSAIVDAPELQADLAKALQDDDSRMEDSFNEDSVVVQAMLERRHGGQPDQLLYVGQLAESSNRILKVRGLRERFEPKTVGWTLRKSPGFTPKRNGQGFGIRMTEAVRCKIHQLACALQILTATEANAGCSECERLFASGTEKEKIDHEIGPIEIPTS